MKYSGILLLAAAMVCAPLKAKAAAEAAAPAPAQAPGSSAPAAVESAALDLLKAMSAKLAAAKSISFRAIGAFDVPAGNGQPLFYYSRSDVLLVRPNKLRVIVPGDGPPSEFYFDGDTVAVLTPKEDLVAVTSAPGDLDHMLRAIYEKAGIYFPFVDLIVADPYKALTSGLKSAFVIGKSTLIGGTATDIVSVSDDHVHLQIWIGAEDKLPRLIWASAADGTAKPRHMVEFSDWKLNGAAGKEAFAPKRTAKTKEISFARPDEPKADASAPKPDSKSEKPNKTDKKP